MAITGAAVCAGGKPQLKFTYTGDYVVRDDGVVELRSTGTLVFIDPAVIDVFMVGGGGGGGRYMVSQTPIVSNGGAGGGGTGGWAGSSSGQLQAPAAGGANTGGGGGGAAANYSGGMQGGSGGSGIVCFRDAAELPELAGTWVLNERLYAPENDISENISFTATTPTLPADTRTCTAVSVSTQYVSIKPSTANWITAYNILVNKWINKYQTWTFPAGATASDEFRAWLASNATKQA
mgnify:CR=1 FL=1|nr:MAG TPA: hypothetical protein [Caudoviricetes sp.]